MRSSVPSHGMMSATPDAWRAWLEWLATLCAFEKACASVHFRLHESIAKTHPLTAKFRSTVLHRLSFITLFITTILTAFRRHKTNNTVCRSVRKRDHHHPRRSGKPFSSNLPRVTTHPLSRYDPQPQKTPAPKTMSPNKHVTQQACHQKEMSAKKDTCSKKTCHPKCAFAQPLRLRGPSPEVRIVFVHIGG